MQNLFLYLWYKFWKLTASLGLQMYYSHLQVEGLHHIPNQGPVIFAVNHQNSFLDAILVACVIRRKSFFLARGDVFKKKWARTLLSSLGIMPIYRTRDGHGKVKDNSAIFETCQNILKHDGAVMIFPEGNHDMRWRLRPLQRGVARIAIQSQRKRKMAPIQIVPVGLQFENHMNAASRVLVQFAEPLDVDKYVVMDNADDRAKMDLLLHDLFNAMKGLILNIPEKDYDTFVFKWKAARRYYSNQLKQLEADQRIIDSLQNNEAIELGPGREERKWSRYFIYPWVPLGWITHILPRLIISSFIKSKVKDPQFIAPMNFAFGLALYPLNAIGWGVVIGIFTNWWAGLAGAIVVLLIGKITLRYWH